MATKPRAAPTPAAAPPAEPPPLNETEIAFTPAPALEGAVNEPATDTTAGPNKKDQTPKEQPPIAAVVDDTRFRVLSSGLSTPSGPRYRDDVLSSGEIGDAARIAQLLARGSIGAVYD